MLYSNKHKITEMIEKEYKNLPALYLFNSNNNRFLDDILLFAKISESFIAKDIECDSQNIKEILADKDISNGILVFINDGQEKDEKIEIIKETLGFEQTTYLQRLIACDVYLVK